MTVTSENAVDLTIIAMEERWLDRHECGAIITWGIRIKTDRRVLVKWKLRRKECRRTAVAVGIIACPNHGIARVPICRLHRRMARTGKAVLLCASCDLPVVYREP
jgi:hypothetical protein